MPVLIYVAETRALTSYTHSKRMMRTTEIKDLKFEVGKGTKTH